MYLDDIVFEIDSNGNLHGLYTDEINLFDIGKLINIKRASDVEFNEEIQMWEVKTPSGQVVYRNQNREKAIAWEIKNFGPSRPYYKD